MSAELVVLVMLRAQGNSINNFQPQSLIAFLRQNVVRVQSNHDRRCGNDFCGCSIRVLYLPSHELQFAGFAVYGLDFLSATNHTPMIIVF